MHSASLEDLIELLLNSTAYLKNLLVKVLTSGFCTFSPLRDCVHRCQWPLHGHVLH